MRPLLVAPLGRSRSPVLWMAPQPADGARDVAKCKLVAAA